MKVETITIRIYIAGDYNTAHELCRRYCYDTPFCVNLCRRDYVCHAGAESGVMVEIVNYPRFPKTEAELLEHAHNIGVLLARGLCQRTFLIVGLESTEWWTHEDDGTFSPATENERGEKKMSDANKRQVGGQHYKKLAIEPWDYILRNNIGFLEGSAIKYLTRWRDRGGIADLEKAKHFIEKLIEWERSQEQQQVDEKKTDDANQVLLAKESE